MGFIPTGQRVVMQTAMDKLWEDMQKPVTIVKKALLVATNEGTTFVPGYGEASNETNYVSTPQSEFHVFEGRNASRWNGFARNG
jgi:hypothetical protein